MPIYDCKMTVTVNVSVKADSESEALEWLQTHTIDDVREQTTCYDIDYDEEVLGEADPDDIANDGAIDISE